MISRAHFLIAMFIAAAGAVSAPVVAQPADQRPIRIVVPYPPGGAAGWPAAEVQEPSATRNLQALRRI